MDILKELENPYIQFESSEQLAARIAAIDDIIKRQLDEILHHPEFQSLEANWRGLYHLVHQIEFDRHVKIHVLKVSKREILKHFDRVEPFENNFLYETLFTNVYRLGSHTRFNLLIGAYEFDHSPTDVSILEKISKTAAKAFCPFVAGVAPSMFYLDNLGDFHDFRDVTKNFEQIQFTAWDKFRDTPEARFVGLCLPHILLRQPYKTAKNFEYTEADGKNELLWGNAAFAFGGCVAKAAFEKNWVGKMRGLNTDGEIFGVGSYRFVEDEKAVESSLDVQLRKYFNDLYNLGFLVLLDDAGGKPYFYGTASTQKPKVFDSQSANFTAKMSAQLENVLACSRFAAALMGMRIDNYHTIKTKDELRRRLMNWLNSYYLDRDDAPDDEKVRKPLREYNLYLNEIPEIPDEYSGILFIRPTYLLDDTQLATRFEIHFPSPKNPPF